MTEPRPIADALAEAASRCGISPSLLCRDGRGLSQDHIRLRDLALLMVYETGPWTTPELGRAIGRSHSTVVEALWRARVQRATDAERGGHV